MFDAAIVTQLAGSSRTAPAISRARVRDEVVRRADAAQVAACRAQLELFSAVADLDRARDWQQEGARDLAHWLSMRYGISCWKAHRWIGAARALRELPRVRKAFGNGQLGVDKLLELCRFATPQTEHDLLVWARKVSVAAVRRRGDLEVRRSEAETCEVERARTLSWWYLDEGRRFGLEAELPAAQGAIVAKALERMATQIPLMPDEDDGAFAAARRADALVALCSARIAADPDPDRATVVVHASLGTLASHDPERAPGGEIEDGPVIPAATVRRLACTARVQTVVESREGEPLALGRLTRQPSRAMVRLVRQRDRGCVPRLRHPAVHRGSPRRVVAPRRAHRPLEPRAHLLVPPSVGA